MFRSRNVSELAARNNGFTVKSGFSFKVQEKEPLESFGISLFSHSHSTATTAVSTQYTNVTDT